MDPKKIYVFTDVDFDGAASVLALHWVLGVKPDEIQFTISTVANIRKELLFWLETNSLSNYDKVFFLDLDTSSCIDLIDHPNVEVIDHHLTHVAFAGKYKQATVNITETTSCAKLIYSHFNLKNTLTAAQKYLIALADDYDSYKLLLPETYNMNCLFSNTQKTFQQTRAHKFVVRFYEGFSGFNKQESNVITEYTTDRDKVIKALKIFAGKVTISQKPVMVVGTSTIAGSSGSGRFVNDVCEFLIKEHKADVVFFININNSHVSWRKSKSCDIDVSKIAEKLCAGGGHAYAAGGTITDSFMEFTKQLALITE